MHPEFKPEPLRILMREEPGGVTFDDAVYNRLLFSRRSSVGGAVGASGPLNSLWLLDTRLVGETPRQVGVDSVLYADWLNNNQFLYSTAERTIGAPGWKAHNNIVMFDLATRASQLVIAPLTHFAYDFWGASFMLAPDRKRMVSKATATSLVI